MRERVAAGGSPRTGEGCSAATTLTRPHASRSGTLSRGAGEGFTAFLSSDTTTGSRLAIPVRQVVQHVVPVGEARAQLARHAGYARPVDDRYHGRIADDEVVHLDEQRRPLHRVEFRLGGAEGPVVLIVAPARDVAPLPFVFLRGDFRRQELPHE